MRKNILLASLFVASTVVSTSAIADIHFGFALPFNVTKISGTSGMTGIATSLMVDVDSGTALGLYGEEATFTGTGGDNLSIAAFRIQKSVTDTVNVGLNMGTIDIVGADGTAAAPNTGNVADIFGNAKLLSTKGKINSYLSAELKYRIARTGHATLNKFGGVQFGLGAGLNF